MDGRQRRATDQIADASTAIGYFAQADITQG